jgi:cell division protein FtsQ
VRDPGQALEVGAALGERHLEDVAFQIGAEDGEDLRAGEMLVALDFDLAGSGDLEAVVVEQILAETDHADQSDTQNEERRSDLERLPWVAHATVMRLLPNHLRIAVTERVPVAFVRQGTELGLVDANGVLLDMPAQSAGDPHYSFPVLTGLNAADPLSVRAARMAVYAKFMKDLDATGEKLTQSLSEVDVSNPEDVKAVVPSGANDILVHFGDENFVDRFHEFKQHLPEWLTQYPKLASADMRYERQVVLEMAAGSAVPTNSAPAAAPEITTTAAEPVAAAARKEHYL